MRRGSMCNIIKQRLPVRSQFVSTLLTEHNLQESLGMWLSSTPHHHTGSMPTIITTEELENCTIQVDRIKAQVLTTFDYQTLIYTNPHPGHPSCTGEDPCLPCVQCV